MAIFILLISPMLLTVFPIHGQVKKVGIDVTPGRVKDLESELGQKLLNWLVDNLTAAGYDVVLIEEITPDALEGLDALVIGKIYNEDRGFSSAELDAIANWFREGGKFIWVGADNDYTEPYLNPEDTSFKSKEPNKILEAIGSHLRIDHMSVEDPENNAGAAYIVVANRTVGGINGAGKAAEITKGVDIVLFYGPAGIAGYKDGKFVNIEDVIDGENIFWLCRTGPKGTVVSYDGVAPEAYNIGYTGRLYLAVAEEIPVASDLFTIVYSKVIVTGESIIGDKNIITSQYRGIKLQGPTFIINVFKWGTEIRVEPNVTGYIIIGIIVIIVVIAVVTFTLRRQ